MSLFSFQNALLMFAITQPAITLTVMNTVTQVTGTLIFKASVYTVSKIMDMMIRNKKEKEQEANPSTITNANTIAFNNDRELEKYYREKEEQEPEFEGFIKVNPRAVYL